MGILLNTQHLSEVLSLLLPKSSSLGGAEKRRATRIHVEAPVTLWHLQQDTPGPAMTVLARDLSLSGIGFLQTTPPRKGGQFMLKLPRPKTGSFLLVLCQITFSRSLADNLFVVGAEFIRLLEHDDEPAAASTPACITAN